uniref:Serine/threonine-protein kinase 11-interacting protein n=1 Tax=Ornithodoros turicata TaxID=34597 RepID=A0A2R5LL16_9ACAR
MSSNLVRNDMVRTLSTFLRKHGDLVLNGTRRLTLTTGCLNALNDIFSQFLGAQDNDSFTVPYGCSGNSNFMCDVFFLHDFLQKACSLKIVQSSSTIQGGLDLSKFRCLRILELKRVPPHLLVGVDSLILQLETLICQRSISSLKEVLWIRSTARQPWLKLKIANFSHNSITCLDDSLTQVPGLQYFDCSNNCISDATGIKYIHNVRVLNLSYNFLECIDSFSEKAQMSLAVLCLRNNCIETTQGLATLRGLKELDISFNCLSDGKSLEGLKQLSCLNLLKMEGNPITFHHDYYVVLTSNLCGSVVTCHFVLDNQPLPRKYVKISNSASSTWNVESIEPSTVTPSVGSSVQNPNQLSAEMHPSLHEVPCAGASLVQHDPSESNESEKLVVKANKVSKLKRRVLRVAAILDKPSVQDTVGPPSMGSDVATSTEIVDYKNRLESRKQRLGDEWLVGTTQVHLPGASETSQSSNASAHGDAEQIASKDTLLTEGRKDTLSDDDSGRAESVTTVLLKETSPVDDRETDMKEQPDPEQQRKISEQSQGVEVLPDQPDHFAETDVSVVDGLSWIAEGSESRDTVETGEDLDSKLFLARKYVDGQETTVFLGIKDSVVRESESLTGKIVQNINLTSVVSAALDNDDTAVRLKLDTIVRSKRELYYVFDDSGDAVEFHQVLMPFVRAKALKDMTAECLQCLQCGTQFPKREVKKKVVEESINKDTDKKRISEVDVCPQCESRFLLEAASPTQASKGPRRDQEKATKGGDSGSEDSIEAVNTDSAHQLYRPGFRKSQSDITILSNPSQSSITVLSSTSAAALNLAKDGERTVSPPPNVVLPTVTEILNEPTGYTKGVCSGIEKAGSQCYAEPVLSDSSFESARSQVTLGRKSGAGSAGSAAHLKSISPWDILHEFDTVTSETFTLLDHRIKLYLELSMFAKDEDFFCALKMSLVPSTTLEEVPALFVMSTKRAYFFKIAGEESDSPESWLQVLENRPLTCLKSISSMLGNQGFRLSWHADRGNVPWQLCLLRDADHCNCFLQVFTGRLEDVVKTMPKMETTVNESLAQLAKEVLPFGDTLSSACDIGREGEVVLYIMVFWCPDKGPKNTPVMEPVSLVVTKSDICLARENYIKDVKVHSRFRTQYKFLSAQRISNLTAMHLHEDLVTVTLTFLDEDADGVETKWIVRTATKASLHTFLNTLRVPWEELFGIEMPLIFMS